MHYLYKITNLLSGKVYIGQSNKENERWRQHKYFSRQENPLQYIHRAMAKYGVENFIYEVIAMCKESSASDELEKQLIKQHDSQNKLYGYNIGSGGEVAWNRGLPREQQPMFGKKQSEFFLKRIVESNSGKKKPLTEEWRQHISESLIGHLVSEETKQKISIAQTGKFVSEETGKKISESNMGRIHSEETKDKMSSSHKQFWKNKTHHSSKVTYEIVEQIRKEYSETKMTKKELAKKYSLTTQSIGNIISFKTWNRK